MIKRTYETADLETLLPEDVVDFSPEEFYEGSKSVILTNGKDYGVFQFAEDGIYFGHTYFRSRGKEALEVAHEMLSTFFSSYPVVCVAGLTPLDLPEAVWFIKRLGFKPRGLVVTEAGEALFSVLYKKDYVNG